MILEKHEGNEIPAEVGLRALVLIEDVISDEYRWVNAKWDEIEEQWVIDGGEDIFYHVVEWYRLPKRKKIRGKNKLQEMEDFWYDR